MPHALAANNHLCRKLFDVLVVPVHAVVIFCRRRCGVVRGACDGSLFNFLTLNFDTHHHHSRSYVPGTTEEGKKGKSKKREEIPLLTSPHKKSRTPPQKKMATGTHRNPVGVDDGLGQLNSSAAEFSSAETGVYPGPIEGCRLHFPSCRRTMTSKFAP